MKAIYRMDSKREKGFTMIELLVVIVIVGILGAIVAPSWLGFFTRQKMNAVNSDLVSVIKKAQSDALQKKSRRQLTFSSIGSTPSVTISSSAGGLPYPQVLGTDSETLQLATFERDTSDTWVAASTQEIEFDHNGNISSANVPYIIKVQPQDSNVSMSPRCVVVTTLLGGTKVESGDICNNFSPD